MPNGPNGRTLSVLRLTANLRGLGAQRELGLVLEKGRLAERAVELARAALADAETAFEKAAARPGPEPAGRAAVRATHTARLRDERYRRRHAVAEAKAALADRLAETERLRDTVATLLRERQAIDSFIAAAARESRRARDRRSQAVADDLLHARQTRRPGGG